MQRAFVDTSAWLSYVNRLDRAHTSARDSLQGFRGRLVTSNYVFDETVTLCLSHLGKAIAARVGETLRDPEVVDLVQVAPADQDSAWDLFLARADKSYSFTDCTSFVVMRRLRISDAVTLDDDFRREGFRSIP